MLSRPPPPLAIKAQPKLKKSSPDEARDKWRHRLSRTLREARDKLDRIQARYKRNYDNRLRKQREHINDDDQVYLRKERRDEREHRHKFAAVADGPFKVIKATRQTVVIERTDKSVERVSRDRDLSRVVLAPDPRSLDEVQDAVRPMTDDELINRDYPLNEIANMRDIQE